MSAEYVPMTPAENLKRYYKVSERQGCYKELRDAINYHTERLNKCLDEIEVDISIEKTIEVIEQQINTIRNNTDAIIESLCEIQMKHYRDGKEMVYND